MSIPDDFILLHNRSATQGVYFMTLRGGKEYRVVHDTRTHSLFLYVDSSTGQNVMHHINSKACRRKLIHVLRDKFNEADRPFVPSLFNTVMAYEQYFKERAEEGRPATLTIKENIPVYSTYPVFSVRGAPLTTLLLRIRPVFDFLVTQNDLLPVIMGIETGDAEWDSSMIDEVLKRSGQLVLNTLSLIKTEETSVTKLMPKITSEIEFQPFDMISETVHIISLSEIGHAFKYFNGFPEYLIVEVDTEFVEKPGMFRTYNLTCMTDAAGNLYERFMSEDDRLIKVDGKSYSVVLDPIKPVLLLLRNSPLNAAPAAQEITVIGKYVKPEVTEKVIMPFRTPVSCKQMSLEQTTFDYPCYVQRKFDGNRAIVHSLLGGEIIRYYSRSGYKLSTSFNDRFTEELIHLSKVVCAKLGRPLANLHFDFECYDHGTIHSTIAGLCNAKTAKEGFERLKLHLLSVFVLDDVHKYEERKREYTASDMTLKEIIEFSNTIGLPYGTVDDGEPHYQTLCVSESRMIRSHGELDSFMKESVHSGYEGLVVYPLTNHYVFGHDRLFKLKKIYDGEVRVLDYIESDIEPGAIGSVLVESRPYFGIRGLSQADSDELICYKVTASLKKEFKDNSMHAEIFRMCKRKYFTIICDSFSNTGIPMHSRFKSPLHPDTARLDVDTL
jgi:hypothetical protein